MTIKTDISDHSVSNGAIKAKERKKKEKSFHLIFDPCSSYTHLKEIEAEKRFFSVLF